MALLLIPWIPSIPLYDTGYPASIPETHTLQILKLEHCITTPFADYCTVTRVPVHTLRNAAPVHMYRYKFCSVTVPYFPICNVTPFVLWYYYIRHVWRASFAEPLTSLLLRWSQSTIQAHHTVKGTPAGSTTRSLVKRCGHETVHE